MNDLQTLPQTQAHRASQMPSLQTPAAEVSVAQFQGSQLSVPTHGPRKRDRTIDTLPGLAIFIMTAANTAAAVLAEPHPFWLPACGSFATPVFVVLSGRMGGRRAEGKGFRRSHYVT